MGWDWKSLGRAMLRAPLLLIRIIDSHNQDHDEDGDEEQCLNAF